MVSCSLEHEWTIFVSAKVDGKLDAQAVSNGLTSMSSTCAFVESSTANERCSSSEVVLRTDEASLRSGQLIDASIVGSMWLSTFITESKCWYLRLLVFSSDVSESLIPTSGCNGGL